MRGGPGRDLHKVAVRVVARARDARAYPDQSEAGSRLGFLYSLINP
jgi:hypothetical protein